MSIDQPLIGIIRKDICNKCIPFLRSFVYENLIGYDWNYSKVKISKLPSATQIPSSVLTVYRYLYNKAL